MLGGVLVSDQLPELDALEDNPYDLIPGEDFEEFGLMRRTARAVVLVLFTAAVFVLPAALVEAAL